MNLHAEIIDLASEGYFYPTSSLLASGQVKILPITAEHEELLTSQNLIKRGLLEEAFLNTVVVGGINYNELLHCDRMSILLNLRIANYGAGTKIKTTCAECDHEFEQDVSFAFRSKPFNFSGITRGENKLFYVFPRCKKKVCYRLATCKEQEIYNKQGWLAFAKAITISIEDVENINEFYDYQLGVADSKLFRAHYDNYSPGYFNEITLSCPACKASRKSNLDIDTDIFGVRPESKLLIHSEIFDLCYYGEGAFTQDGVYHMPTSLRSFYIKKLVEAKKAEAEAQKDANKGASPSSKISKPPKVKP